MFELVFLEPILFGGVRALVLPQNDMLDIIDSPWETLPSLRSGGGRVGDKVRGAREGGSRIWN